MKITRTQLQEYFEAPLPPIAELADAFTFHAFEIDSIEGDVLDVKVLPNRAADANTPQGLALELAAILDLPLKQDGPYTYSTPAVAVSLARINSVLGAAFAAAEVEDVFRRLRFRVEKEGEVYRVVAPAPRTDIVIPEDVAEEVGQILGYDRVPELQMPALSEPVDQNRYKGIERMKDSLVAEGFIEVSTQSFAKQGDIELANPLDKSKPFLRTSLEENLADALERAKRYAPLVLPPAQKPKLFEVGTVFPKSGEYMELCMTERVPAWGENFPTHDNLTIAKLEDYGKDYTPKRYELGLYKPFSVYPFALRDIALWTPAGTEGAVVEQVIREQAGELLVRLDQFDRFEKEGRISYGFRLAFQSMDRTLTEEEISGTMDKVTTALTAKGYEPR